MLEDEDWESDPADDFSGVLAPLAAGAGVQSDIELDTVLERWIGVSGDPGKAREQVRRDIGRLKGRPAYRWRLIEMMREQRCLQDNLDDSFDD